MMLIHGIRHKIVHEWFMAIERGSKLLGLPGSIQDDDCFPGCFLDQLHVPMC
jgi:hypothetical protein